MDKRLWAVAISGIVAIAGACASTLPGEPAPGERLFFALQIDDGEKVIARPKLVGDAGRPITMNLVDPLHPGESKVALELRPEKDGDGYRVHVRLVLPGMAHAATGELALLHGEERSVPLDPSGSPVTVKLMLMRVKSPEFDAFMELARRHLADSAS